MWIFCLKSSIKDHFLNHLMSFFLRYSNGKSDENKSPIRLYIVHVYIYVINKITLLYDNLDLWKAFDFTYLPNYSLAFLYTYIYILRIHSIIKPNPTQDIKRQIFLERVNRKSLYKKLSKMHIYIYIYFFLFKLFA